MNIELTPREVSIARFAIHRFMSAAYSNADNSAQLRREDYIKFLDDAADAGALLGRLDAHDTSTQSTDQKNVSINPINIDTYNQLAQTVANLIKYLNVADDDGAYEDELNQAAALVILCKGNKSDNSKNSLPHKKAT